MGHRHVCLLDGGLPGWLRSGLSLAPTCYAPPDRAGDFVARPVGGAFCDAAHVLAALADPTYAVIDARSGARFRGEAPEPRPGLLPGRMPGALNLPFEAGRARPMTGQPASALAVLDWRRRTHAMYDAVRASASPAAAHAAWRMERDRMFAEHPASPLLPEDRPGFAGLVVPAYDDAWRFEVAVDTRWSRPGSTSPTGTDGVVPFQRAGRPVPGPGHPGRLVARLLRQRPVRSPARRDGRAATYGAGRYLLDTVKGADLGRANRRVGARPQLRLQPVLRLRPGLGLPARPSRQPAHRRRPRGRALLPRLIRTAHQQRVLPLVATSRPEKSRRVGDPRPFPVGVPLLAALTEPARPPQGAADVRRRG